MASLSKLYRQWFENLLDNFLANCISEEDALTDCRHDFAQRVLVDPDVSVCVQCGLVFTTDRDLWEQELVRPFAEALS